MLSNLYQDQPRWVRVGRWVLHKPQVPFAAASMWLYERRHGPAVPEIGRMSWRGCWDLANGMAAVAMHDLYPAEDFLREEC